ncbi:MAG: helix-turn-helix domain-containing protein [Dehalococcoidales bacterium]|nr:helix-turn-helix domain-containing protein [Dehalococcoidales bacterium]
MHSNAREKNPVNWMVTVDEVAQLLHVHPTTVRRWERQSLLKSYRLGPKGNVRFKREDIVAFIDNGSRSEAERSL